MGAVRELITKAGYYKIKEEQEKLKRERPEIIQAIADARAKGDLKENADYHAAREKQGMIESKISYLESILTSSDIVSSANIKDKDIVDFSATVLLQDVDTEQEVTYTIVSAYESDISLGLLSSKSPIAQALMNKKVSDEVEVRTPKSTKYFTILKISYE